MYLNKTNEKHWIMSIVLKFKLLMVSFFNHLTHESGNFIWFNLKDFKNFDASRSYFGKT